MIGTTTIASLVKNGLYIPVFLVACGLSEYTATSVTVLMALIILDVVLGIAAAWVVDGKRSVRSRTATVGVVAKLTVLLIPATVALVAKGVGTDLSLLIVGTMGMLIFSEGYSIFGNIKTIRTGKRSTEYDAVAGIIKAIRRFFLSMLEKGNIQ